MMLVPLALAFAAQNIATPATVTPKATAKAAETPPSAISRYDRCITLAADDPQHGEVEANLWLRDGGLFPARQCLGIALANQQRWQAAAEEFETAADQAEIAHDKRAATYWSQAGNAWLAVGNPVKARSALDAALAAGTLDGVQKGEALFDRARALVAAGNMPAARTDIDTALSLVREDALIWLASATLARKMNDLPRARQDVAEAYNRASDDPAVYLEIGNIAAAGGDEAGAKAAWTDAVRIGPDSQAGRNAQNALKQFGVSVPTPVSTTR
jgi:tetratricopeptide (TPR) repeat protein